MSHPLQSDLDGILLRTRDLWEELRGGRLFITGGTGFFGCWLLESLVWANVRLDLGAEVTVLTRNRAAFVKKARHLAENPGIRLVEGDVRNFGFPEGPFSHIVHAATEASASLNAEAPLEMFSTIVEGTRRVLDFAHHCGARKFLLTSSGAVYGSQPAQLAHIPEEYTGGPDPLDALSAYGEGKRAAEQLCCLYSRRQGLEVKIARGFAFAGPHLPLTRHFAIGNFLHDALQGRPIHVRGDGTPRRSYLYSADLAVWLWTILVRGVPCRAYNVGSGDDLSVLEVAQLVAKAGGVSAVRVAESAREGAPTSRYVPDVARARRELGLDVWTDLETSIRKTLAYYAGANRNEVV